ncbi:MAG: endonuclease domain-containing protein [Hyphomicrobiales bacterium]|nr:endonuclease domain-containing protein [Alphaproteobacteria bacterium]
MSSAEKQPAWQVSKKLRSRARSLRQDSTDAERLIWSALRAHRMHGASFRRQTPIGPYIADFVCHQASLVIELDGGQHFEDENLKRDARRDAFFGSKGFRVLRFNNHDVMTNQQGVLEAIAAALEASPSPTLPRKRGRESGPAQERAAVRGRIAS